ncbi:ABC transporter ATP-binding protein [Nonomuraea sp. SMC257]|uniref:ABC transporter ATP-binding protein n=1 Tax=Nonomuraea montanisoli TaxID=2741721 RepID=A0A7Y6IBB6_9ACTN|nr:ABC transporter ATP-binding protein [Nonomuraea montanisoli]NUW34553.1 ABC transporter ATP-binding protein [Nonomuraea montanisoli]
MKAQDLLSAWRRRQKVLGHLVRLTVRTNPRVAAIILATLGVQSVAPALLATTQRWLVQATGLGVSAGLLVALLVGALAQTANTAGNRVQTNLRFEVEEKVDLVLGREIADITTTPSTVDHLESPEFLNRLAVLRKSSGRLASSCWTMVETAGSVAGLALSVALLVGIHPFLATMALLGIVPLMVAKRGQRAMDRIRDLNAEGKRQEERLHMLCVRPEPAKEVRICRNGWELSALADRLWRIGTRRETVAQLKASAWEAVGWSSYLLGFGASIAAVAMLCRAGQASTGDLVLVISLGSSLRIQIGMTVSGMTRLGAVGHIMGHYLWLRAFADSGEKASTAPPSRLAKGLRLRDVEFIYPGRGTPALSGVNLDLEAGSVIGLVGENGAGKSTLIKLLTGVYRPTRGTITVDGRPLTGIRPGAWFAKQSGAFQDFLQPQTTVMESIGIGDLEHLHDRAFVGSSAERAGADSVITQLPQGIDTQLGSLFGGVEPSIGQWQKLALARAAMREQPLLLVLDEPTAALDPQAEHELFERFAALASRAGRQCGAVTVLVSHRFSTVTMADHIVVLDRGTVVEQGTHAELIRAEGLYHELFTAQAKGYL